MTRKILAPVLAASALAVPMLTAAAPQADAAVTRSSLVSSACRASFYSEPQRTASGERFNPRAMTAAHRSLPMGARVRVTNLRTHRSVVVRINDRGPYAGGRCIDLSSAAFGKIANRSAGTALVRIQRIG